MAKPVKVRTSSGEWVDLAIQVPSANEPTFTGTTSSSQFSATNSVGDEGGEIKFAKAATNTTLNTGVTLDVYQDKVRLFETAGTNRGGYFDMTTLGAGVSTNLAPGLTLITKTNFTTASQIDITNCFSSTYSNYQMTVNLTAASLANYANFQFLSGTTPATSSYYFGYYGWRSNSTALTAAGDNISNVYFLEYDGTRVGASLSNVLFFNPNKTLTTSFATDIIWDNGAGSVARRGGGFHNVANAYDGIRIATNSGTISGTVRIYGLKD